MASSINADNGVSSGSAGLKSSADSSGVLALQTNGTTAISIDASQAVSFTNQPTYSGGTANGVAYLNGSKVLTTGSALVFDGTNLGVGVTPVGADSRFKNLEVGVSASLSGILASSTNLLTYIQHNCYVDSSGVTKFKYSGGSNYASQYNQNNGNHYWQTSSAAGTGPTTSCTLNTNMTLDLSGNLGLGVTPSAWGTYNGVLDLKGNGSLAAYNQAIALAANAYYNGSNWIYKSTTTAGFFQAAGNAFQWYQAPSGTAGNAITFTQAMTLDASGNLVIGDTSADTKFNLVGGAARISGTRTAGSFIDLTPDNTGSNGVSLGVSYYGSGSYGPMKFSTGGSERARITSGGYSKFSNDGTYISSTGSYHEINQTAAGSGIYFRNGNASQTGATITVWSERNTTNNTFYAIDYYNNGAGAYKFRVADSGNVTNTNGSYGTISDAKMKTDIVDAGSQWDDIKGIRFRKFKMKNDPDQIVQLGVVAQELEQTSPGLVEEHIDRDEEGNNLGTTTKSVKTSVLLMKAAVALQEAMARIEQLESTITQLQADVAALKGASA